MTEYLRLSGMYWCISSLDVCNALEGNDLDMVIELIQGAKNSDGGYACAAGSDSHILHTLCAVQVSINSLDFKRNLL